MYNAPHGHDDLFRDYGLHPGIPNNGEDNFLLAHLFVGAAHPNIRCACA